MINRKNENYSIKFVLILIFSDATYFTMLFAAGIGIGLFYFGVAETIFHYQPGAFGNRYWDR